MRVISSAIAHVHRNEYWNTDHRSINNTRLTAGINPIDAGHIPFEVCLDLHDIGA